jgi:hypothetical protein
VLPSSGCQLIEAVSGALIEPWHEVAVAVESGFYRGVAEASLDGLRVLAVGYEPRRVSVSQVVHPARLAHRSGHCRFEDSPREVGATERTARGVGEDQPVAHHRVSVQVLTQHPADDTREGDRPTRRASLRILEDTSDRSLEGSTG